MLLNGKRALITGIVNERSIAFHVAQMCSEYGAELVLTYHPVMKSRVEEAATKLKNVKAILELDVGSDQSMNKFFAELSNVWPKYDLLLHSIAFSNKENLANEYFDISRDDFKLAMDISVFSFTDLMKRSKDMLTENGSAITLTYYGAEKVVPNYNIMGVAKAALEASVRYLAADFGEKQIRVNSISSGPIKTLAAMAIGGFNGILKNVELNAPLKRNITAQEVAKTAVYLFSDLASAVTAQNIYVDAGYSSVLPINSI